VSHVNRDPDQTAHILGDFSVLIPSRDRSDPSS
jgi:hypothetical protein